MLDRNRLDTETSPYLLQHRDNPVHWQPWSDEVLARARAEGRPILLSVGYAACHWCHVMAHESFEDPDTAALMNELFVNIKVDREERPDLDAVYQQALALLGEQGGWPLTMFLTPDGDPYWGGTYFPPDGRYGRPAFPDVLRSMSAIYADQKDKVTKNVTALRDGLARLSKATPGGSVPLPMLDRFAAALTRQVDPFHGGMGSAPKFPQPSTFAFLWRTWLRTGLPPHRHAVMTTLTALCEGGIYDHLGGGFARYSVDDEWLVPHFEKMLYDNAQLVTLLTDVWRIERRPLFQQRVAETVDWITRDMLVGTAFASSLDADSEGEEGRFYVWNQAEIDDILGEHAALFSRFYDVTPRGNWEGKTILNRRAAESEPSPAEEKILARCREQLMARRNDRIAPGRDDKVLTDWNGMTIAALAHAGLHCTRPDWVNAAASAFDFISDNLGKDGQLLHSWREGDARHAGTIDDYAQMIAAAIRLFQATAEPRYLDRAVLWANEADSHFWDPVEGGYFMNRDDQTDLPIRPKTIADNATPSGNGTMAAVLAELWLITGDTAYRNRAESIVAAFSGGLDRSFSAAGALLAAVETLALARQLVIIGSPGNPDLEALVSAAGHAPPSLVIQILPPDRSIPADHPAAGKTLVDGKAAAYLCQGMSCSLPITSADALRSAVGGLIHDAARSPGS